jgi:mono/diheme cytochrome c family protein
MAGFPARGKARHEGGLTGIKAAEKAWDDDRGEGGCPMRLFTSLTCLAMTLGAAASAQDVQEGAALYADFCAVCHGESLQGDGPMAEVLTVPPTDLTQLAQGAEFPVLDVARQIDGRARIAAHGGEMPLFGRYFEGQGPDVALEGPGGQPILVSRPIADLIAFLMEEQS